MSKIRYRNRNLDTRRATAQRITEDAAKRTPEQQLARLDAKGERAVAERARLHAVIQGRKRAA